MTALFGLLGRRGRVVHVQDLSGPSAALAPFGDADHWEATSPPVTFALGTRGVATHRLAAGAARGFVVAADCHLTHRHDLASRLGLPQSTDQVELIASGYDRWGEDLPNYLEGEFTLAIADLRRGGVFLVRDHAGKRPLAVYESDGLVAFASTALALTGLPEVGCELDEERAVEVLLDATATGRTFVKNVRSMLPGSRLWIDSIGSRMTRWWEGRFTALDLGSVEAHARALRPVFDAAVTASLEGATTPGLLLSGGLDSASVAAVAAQALAPSELRTYTLVPPNGWSGPEQRGWVQSEREEIEALAARYRNIRPSFVTHRRQSLFKDEPWWELGVPPFRNPMTSKALFDCFRDASADGVDLILWGAAGNMAFSAAGDKWLAELARRGRVVELGKELRAWSHANRLPLRYVLRHHFLERLFPKTSDRIQMRRGSSDLHDILLVSAVSQERLADLDLDKVIEPVALRQRDDWTRDLGRIFANDTTNAEMGAAMRVLYRLELFDPTADRRLLEVAGTQPDWRRNYRGEWRAIVRAAMRDALPPEIVDRVAIGEQLPEYLDILTARREELENEIEEMRDHPASRRTLDVERLERLMVSWPRLDERNRKAVMYAYREALPKTIGMSRYLRWFEERAKRVAAGGPPVIVHDPFADFI